MVPEKLQLRNFMCYGEDVPPLYFAGLHVACLSGQNGAGKSALLDAITWALWGKARAKSDDDLIKLGHEEMEVALEFCLDDHLYRVVRRRKRAKRAGITTLDFQICEDGGEWRRLTGDTVSETQDVINRALRIEYDTFINSAFLLQGRADEFTSRKPGERKQVLADILGLAEYEELEQRAKGEANRLSKDADIVESHLVRLQTEVLQQPILEQALAEAQERVASIEETLADCETDLHDLRDQAARLQERSERREALGRTIAQHEQAQQGLYARIAEAQANIQRFESIIAQQTSIEAGCGELAAAQSELEAMEQRREEYDRLLGEFRTWDDKLKELRHALELEQRSAHEHLLRLDTQMARRPNVEAERAELTQQLTAIQRLQADLIRLRTEEQQLAEQQTLMLELQVQIKETQGTINVRHDALIAAQHEQQRRSMELAAQAETRAEIEREQRAVRGELLRFQAFEDELATRRDELARIAQQQGKLEAEYKNVEAEGKAINEKLRLIEHGTATCPVCHGALGVEELAHLRQQYKDERADLRNRVVALRHDTKQREAEAAAQRNAIEQLEHTCAGRAQAEARRAQLDLRYEQASAAKAALEDVAQTLHTLEQQLTQRTYAPREQAHLRQLEAELEGLGDLAAIKPALAQIRSLITTTERQLSQTDQIQQRVARIDAELAAIAEAEAQHPVVAAQHEQLSAQLDGEQYGLAERQQRDAIRAAGQALGYSREAHSALREQIAALQHWDVQARELERALDYIGREREQVQRDQEQRERIDTDLADLRQQLALLDQQLQEKPLVDRKLRDAAMQLQQVQRQLALAQSDRGSAEAELRRCERAAEQHAAEAARLSALRDELGVYEELAQAFGKKGIQAMLIETAIPELEHEANALLGRMTDNQFHLAFETQRDTKKGDATIETLDIRISDGLGTRDYQMFSGGEAFRVNFAIRIALSKLLARRAGANLRTLVIDEGFGTQDGKGRDRIVEAINTIEGDFDRILVITHIQELKDMFGSQIEITKTVDGSTWAIA